MPNSEWERALCDMIAQNSGLDVDPDTPICAVGANFLVKMRDQSKWMMVTVGLDYNTGEVTHITVEDMVDFAKSVKKSAAYLLNRGEDDYLRSIGLIVDDDGFGDDQSSEGHTLN